MKTDPPRDRIAPIKDMGGQRGDQHGRLGNDKKLKET